MFTRRLWSAMFLSAAIGLAASEVTAGEPARVPPVERSAVVFLIAGQSNAGGVATAIKPVKHKEGPPGGFYRSQMSESWLRKIGYGLRWHVESFFSGMKRTMGSSLNARSDHGQFLEAALKVLTYATRR